MHTGKLVHFFEHRVIISGICLEAKGDRLHILCEDGREVNMHQHRMLHISTYCIEIKQPRSKLLQTLTEHVTRQTELTATMDAARLWENMPDKNRLYDFDVLSRAFFGSESTSDHENAVIRCLMHERIHFKLQGNAFRANTPAQVAKHKTLLKKEVKKQQTLERFTTWLRMTAAGTSAADRPDPAFIDFLKDYVIFGKDTKHYKEIIPILTRHNLADQKDCFALLNRLGIWDEDENLLLVQHNVPHTWPTLVEQHVAELQQNGLENILYDPDRIDLTHLETCTIDEPFTRDVDDALSVEFTDDNIRLGIHITDAASCIPVGSPVDREAARRGTSVYMPDGKVPMIPQVLSENLLSLQEGKTQPAVSFLITLSPTGELLDYQGALSRICVDRKLSYAEVDVAIEQQSRFTRLHTLMTAIQERRKAAGASWVLIPELQVRLDNKKQIVLHMRDRESPSQMLVAECMILANYCTALLFQRHNTDALYRRQAPPTHQFTHEGHPSLYDLFSHVRHFSRVDIDTRPGEHSSLGLA
ncbi:MAG: RNB domain-containing ribonuclease, partial [Deltaproteobacteria bacterium]|nr:RNB domain-containing ribonuclease [Deltaproteobacteria bacterium]